MTRKLSSVSFILLAVVAASLAAISVGGNDTLYTSPVIIALWASVAVASVASCVAWRLWRRPVVGLLHLALLLILGGAFLTWLTGETSMLSLRVGDDARDGFTLESFEVESYAGSSAPRDFVAVVNGKHVSLNSPGHFGSVTLVLSSCDDDFGGATFTVSRDPWGITVSYSGYLLLALAFLAYFFVPGTRWRRALKAFRAGAAVIMVALSAQHSVAVELSDGFIDRLSETAIFHNGRVTTVGVMSRDFASTIGAPGNPSELVAGLLFDFNRWRTKPIIRVSNGELRRLIGIDRRRASFDDFYNAVTAGRLDIDDPGTRRVYGQDIDRFQAVSMLVGGSLMKLFPVNDGKGSIVWYAPIDRMAAGIDSDRWMFIRKFLGLVNECVVVGDRAGQIDLLEALERYQRRETSGAMPSSGDFALERAYVAVASQWWPGVVVVIAGLSLLLAFIAIGRLSRRVRGAATAFAVLLLLFLTSLGVIRWIVIGHVPLSNGYETMMFMAWCLAWAGVFTGRSGLISPMGILGAGLAMCVASMSGSGASVTGLMPVLNSPLLSVHVVMVMASYALFFMMALVGVAGLIRRDDTVCLAELGRVMLYPALALLAAGIFVGAVWANVSWGRYWGWDPKEVWALITMLVYAFAAHPSIVRRLERPRAFHWFAIVAFASVLMTYFGVNFVLGGLHSYA